MFTEDMLEQEFLVDEVEKLKNEAEGLRHALEKRIKQHEEHDSAGMADVEELAKALEPHFEKLSEQLEEMEVAITEYQERSKNETREMVTGIEENLAGRLSEIDETLSGELEGIKKNFSFVTMELGEVKDNLSFIEQKLDEKASQNSLTSLHKRMTAMFMVNIVGLGGTIMTLALLCYLIMQMAR